MKKGVDHGTILAITYYSLSHDVECGYAIKQE